MIKILHVTDMHIRHDGRLFYSSGRKFQNGFIRNGFNCLNISDRDVTKLKKTFFDISGKKALLNSIISTIENFKPDIVIFGHVDKLDYIDLVRIKEKFPNIVYAQWFLDALIKDGGPDYEKHKTRFMNKYQICDFNFVTTSPDNLDFIETKKTFYIPNPIDSSIETLKVFKNQSFEYDVFIAVSHGQHRATLKRGYIDERHEIVQSLNSSLKVNSFGFNNRNPIWGADFFNEINKCKIGINLSRGKPIKYYSSDRISSLLGSGLLTFIDSKYSFQDFLNKDEVVFFDGINDLNEKLIFFSKNDSERSRIAKKGYEKSHEIFNSNLISKYMIDQITGRKIDYKIPWRT